jgi:hypothetical protein
MRSTDTYRSGRAIIRRLTGTSSPFNLVFLATIAVGSWSLAREMKASESTAATPSTNGNAGTATDGEAASSESPWIRTVTPQEFRLWTKADGQRTVQAKLVAANTYRAKFVTPHDKIVACELKRLSLADQEYVAQSITARTPVAMASVSNPVSQGTRLFSLGSQVNLSHFPVLAGLRSVAGMGPAKPLPANLAYIRVSGDLLARYISQEISHEGQVVDEVLGASVRGISHTTARPKLTLISNSSCGQFDVHLTGTVESDTTSYSGPVSIANHGTTEFSSVKRIRFDGHDFLLEPARTTAQARLNMTGIDSSLGLGRRLSLRIGQQRVDESRGQAEAITAQHAAERINREFDAAVADAVAQFRAHFAQTLKAIVADQEFGPVTLKCCSTGSAIQFALVGSGNGPAIEAPRALEHSADVEIDIHSDLVLKMLTDAKSRELLQTLEQRISKLTGKHISISERVAGSSSKESPVTLRCSADNQWLTVLWSDATGGNRLPVMPERQSLPEGDYPSLPRLVRGD